MDFYAIVDQVIALLRQRQRMTYRALKVQFQLDDDALEALKEEIIEARNTSPSMRREGSWSGAGTLARYPLATQSQPAPRTVYRLPTPRPISRKRF